MVDFMSSLEGNPSEKMLLGLMRKLNRGDFPSGLGSVGSKLQTDFSRFSGRPMQPRCKKSGMHLRGGSTLPDRFLNMQV